MRTPDQVVADLRAWAEHGEAGIPRRIGREAADTIERLRGALVRIADAESGIWGRIAHEALHPERDREVHRTEQNDV